MTDIPQDVISRASAGDLAAFELIYKEYFRFVTNVSFRVVNSEEDAQEVTQDVFMNIYRKLKDFRSDSSLKTWIYRITVNTAINHSKRSAKFRHKHVTLSDAPEIASPIFKENPPTDRETLLQNLFDQINPEQRACLVLRSQQGLSYQQISDTLKIPVNTVRSRLKRAREAMLILKKEAGHEL